MVSCVDEHLLLFKGADFTELADIRERRSLLDWNKIKGGVYIRIIFLHRGN